MSDPAGADPGPPPRADAAHASAWLEHLPAAALVCDDEGRLLFFNARAVALWGGKPDLTQVRYDGLPTLVNEAGETVDLAQSAAARCLHTGAAVEGEVLQAVQADGRRIYYRPRAEPWRGEDGRVRGAIVVLDDVTVEREREDEWRRQEARFRFIFEQLPVGVTWHVKDGDGHEVINNPALARLTGVPNELGLSPQPYREATHPDDRGRQQVFIEKFLRHEIDHYSLEKRFIHADGRLVWVAFTTRRFARVGGRVEALTTMVDITALKEAEAAARERTERLDFILNALPVGVIWTEREGEAERRYCNRTFSELTGLPAGPRPGAVGAVIRESVRAISHPEDLARQDALQARLDRGELDHFSIEKRYHRPDGKLLWGILSVRAYRDATGRKIQEVATLTDVTDRKALENQLQQAAKMQLVGQLAGGVAHDFNNILTVLVMNLQLMRLGTLPPEVAQRLGKMEEMSQRATRLVSQLLMFARRQHLQAERLELNAVLTQTTELLLSALGEDVELDWQPTDEPWWVEADATMLEQVVLNLSLNSRDAMPDGGRLTLRVRGVTLDGPLLRFPERRAGEFVCLEVSDTGSGMTPEVQARVFEPFFTTKDPGRGTGLGMPSVQGVVQQQGGWVEIDSAPGKGTTVAVYLPRLAASG